MLFTRTPKNESKGLAQPALSIRLHRAMILDGIRKMASADAFCSLIVSTDGPLDAPIQALLEQLCTQGRDVRVLTQTGRTFEGRFLNTLNTVFEGG